MSMLCLLPVPRMVRDEAGVFEPGAAGFCSFQRGSVAPLFHAQQVCDALAADAQARFEIRAHESADHVEPGGVALRIDADHVAHAQGYELRVAPTGVVITGGDAAGLYYGVQTFRQMVRQGGRRLPCCAITDHPDVAVRGVMLDISRDKVPTLDTLCALVDDLSEWKINRLELYMEHTFAYRHHREVWAQASPLTGEDVLLLDAYCRERFVELVPNQNSFGHMARWLDLPRYKHLAECPDGYTLPDGAHRAGSFTLAPTHPGTLELLGELYAELLPHFSSRNFNVGCDETWDLGQGRSKTACDARGRDTVYLDFLRQLNELARRHGRTMHFWGDMFWNNFPERIGDIDDDAVMLDWGYYRAYPFAEHGEKLAAAGRRFMFAPGTSTWSCVLGCNEAGLGSNRTAAEAAVACGALGVLNTDWGDGGHLHYLPISFAGFAAGAATSWSHAHNSDDDIWRAVNTHVFRDQAAVVGDVVRRLGDAWMHVAEDATQANFLTRIMQGGYDQTLDRSITRATLEATAAHLDSAIAALGGTRMRRADADLIVDELTNGVRMARYAIDLGRALIDRRTGDADVRRELDAQVRIMLGEHRRLWLARNRIGGLHDSAARLTALLAEA